VSVGCAGAGGGTGEAVWALANVAEHRQATTSSSDDFAITDKSIPPYGDPALTRKATLLHSWLPTHL